MRVQMYFASSNIAAMTSGVMPSKNNCQTTSTLLGISFAPDIHGTNSSIPWRSSWGKPASQSASETAAHRALRRSSSTPCWPAPTRPFYLDRALESGANRPNRGGTAKITPPPCEISHVPNEALTEGVRSDERRLGLGE
jgi:hypothetical protein